MSDKEEKKLPHERRMYVRVDLYAVTHYCCPIRRREVNIQSRVANLSRGGAMLLTYSEGLPVGTEIEISFTLPDKKEHLVTVKAKVRHTGLHEPSPSRTQSLYRSGVEFFMVDAKTEKIIADYILQRMDSLRKRK